MAINFLGGYRNTMTLVLTGLDIEDKAAWAEQELFDILGGREQFADVDVRLLRFDRPDAPTNEQATAHLRITVKDPDPRKVGRRFSNATMELALGGYAGFHTTTPPTPESAYGVYWPALVPAAEVPPRGGAPGRRHGADPAPSPAASASPGPAVWPRPSPASAAAPDGPAVAGPVVPGPLGRICGARSGDKGGNANIGIWTRDPAAYPWLRDYLTARAGSGRCCPSAPRSRCAASSCPTSARSTSSSSACWGRVWPPPPGRTPRPRAWGSTCVPAPWTSPQPCSTGVPRDQRRRSPPPGPAPGGPAQDQRRRDPRRRQRILSAAAELVAERGYQQVGMADIGAAAGITGSAIYRHFDGKSAVLVAMFDHVIDDLSREAGEIVGAGGDALVILRGLIATQVRFVLRDRTLAQVYHNEVANLPEEDRHRLRRKQRLYIEEWVHVLAQLRPDAGDATVRALVHASVGAIQSVLFYQSGLADDQLAALMSSVAEASLFAALLARGDDPPLRLPGGLPPNPPAPDSRLGEDTPSARLPPRRSRPELTVDFADYPDHAAIRDTVAAITRSFGSSYYSAHAEGRIATDELWAALAKQGFVGINLPERFGGGGAGLAELALVCEETAAQGCPMLLLLVSSAISGEVLARYGSEAQQQAWLPQLASGETRIVFAITEPDAGSNTHRLSTTAVRDGADWLLNGTKYYISGVDGAGAILVVARTGTDPGTGHGLLSLFLVPPDAPGLAAAALAGRRRPA